MHSFGDKKRGTPMRVKESQMEKTEMTDVIEDPPKATWKEDLLLDALRKIASLREQIGKPVRWYGREAIRIAKEAIEELEK
jgi:hypothetical protein